MATLYYVTTRTEGSFGRRHLAQMRSPRMSALPPLLEQERT